MCSWAVVAQGNSGPRGYSKNGQQGRSLRLDVIDLLLTLRSLRQSVATHGNGFRLFLGFWRRSDLRPVAIGFNDGALSEEGPLVKLSLLVCLLVVAPRRTLGSFLALGCTPCRWELSRLLSSIRGRQAAKASGELAGTEVHGVVLGVGLKGSLRESMCQVAIRILRATAALAELLWRERRPTSR